MYGRKVLESIRNEDIGNFGDTKVSYFPVFKLESCCIRPGMRVYLCLGPNASCALTACIYDNSEEILQLDNRTRGDYGAESICLMRC